MTTIQKQESDKNLSLWLCVLYARCTELVLYFNKVPSKDIVN